MPTPYKSPYTQALYVPLSTLTIQEGRQQKIRIPNLLIAYVPICARTVRSQLVDGTLAHLPTPPQSSDSGVTHLSYIVYEMRTTLMYFIHAKYLSNNLIGTRNMGIFVLLCKIIQTFMQVNMHIVE